MMRVQADKLPMRCRSPQTWSKAPGSEHKFHYALEVQMRNLHKAPVEIAGYRNAWLPTLSAGDTQISMRWWSIKQEIHADDEYLPWDDETGSDIPPF